MSRLLVALAVFIAVRCVAFGTDMPFDPYGTTIDGGTILDMCRLPSGTICALSAEEVWRSTDAGKSWESLNLRTYVGDGNTWKIACHAGNRTVLVLYSTNRYGNVWISTDEGNTWTRQHLIKATRPLLTNGSLTMVQRPDGTLMGFLTQQLADPTYIFAFNDDNNRLDSITWFPGGIMDPSYDEYGTLWFSLPGSIHCLPAGATKVEVVPVPSPSLSFGVMTAWPAVIIRDDTSMLRYDHATHVWQDVHYPFDALPKQRRTIRFVPDAGGVLSLVGDTKATTHLLYLPRGTATHWSPLQPVHGMAPMITALAIDEGHWLVSTSGDHGLGLLDATGFWSSRSKGIHSSIVRHFAIVNNKAVVASTQDGMVYYRSASRSAWTRDRLSDSIPLATTKDVFATRAGTLLHAYGNRLARSTDGGTSWRIFPTTTVRDPQTHICQHPDGRIFVASPTVLYVSNDDGMTWTTADGPYSNPLFADITIDLNGVLYVASRYGLQTIDMLAMPAGFEEPTGIDITVSSPTSPLVVGADTEKGWALTLAWYRNGKLTSAQHYQRPLESRFDDMAFIGGDTLLLCQSGKLYLARETDSTLQSLQLPEGMTVHSIRYYPNGPGLIFGTNQGSLVYGSTSIGTPEDAPVTPVRASPLPATVSIRLDIPPDAQSVVIYNMAGTMVRDVSDYMNGEECTFGCSELPPGTYRALITSKDATYTIGFIVLH